MKKITLFALLFSSLTFALTPLIWAKDLCQQQQEIYNNGKELLHLKNYLLGNLQFSLAKSFHCSQDLTESSHFAYAYTLVKLDENDAFIHEYLKARSSYLQNSYTLYRFNLLAASVDENFYSSIPVIDQVKFDLWKVRLNKNKFKDLSLSSPITDLEMKKFQAMHDDLNSVDQKSPLLAGTLSAIIPGMGQAYIGQWQAAAVSLIFNSLFLASTITFAKKKMTAPAIAAGALFSMTYIGNIFGAVDGTHKWNDAKLKDKEEHYHQELFPQLYP